MSSAYQVTRSDTRSLEEELVRLWSQNLVGLTPEQARAKIEHSYERNPAGPAHVYTITHVQHARIAGAQSLLPRTYELRGHPLRAAAYVDYAVDVEHRTLGPAMMLLRRTTEAGLQEFDFLFGTPNRKAEAAFRRAGGEAIGLMARYTKVRRSAQYLQRYLPSWLARVASVAVDSLVRGWDSLGYLTTPGAISWREAAVAEAALDLIWYDRPTHMLLAERSAKAVHWRYSINNSPAPIHVWVASDGHGKPFGYVAWRLLEGVVDISDFFCVDAESNVSALLKSFCWQFRKDATVLSFSLPFFGSPAIVQQLRRVGFRPGRGRLPIIVASAVAGLLPPARQWYFTGFDIDAD